MRAPVTTPRSPHAFHPIERKSPDLHSVNDSLTHSCQFRKNICDRAPSPSMQSPNMAQSPPDSEEQPGWMVRHDSLAWRLMVPVPIAITLAVALIWATVPRI